MQLFSNGIEAPEQNAILDFREHALGMPEALGVGRIGRRINPFEFAEYGPRIEIDVAASAALRERIFLLARVVKVVLSRRDDCAVIGAADRARHSLDLDIERMHRLSARAASRRPGKNAKP